MDGILIIDKPAGITSHDVVARCRRILQTKRIGHTGTLDPFATGVMVILVGKATRLAQFLDKDAKEYEAVVRLGFETDTGDRTGSPNSKFQIPNSEIQILVSVEDIEKALTDFRGEIMQTPPMYSAKKVEGKKLYELARKGIEIERKPVSVKIYKLRMTNDEIREKTEDFGLWTLDFGLKVLCSAGTYIRTLAEDIGRKLETGAHLAELRRTKAGKFAIENAVTLEQLEKIADEKNVETILISMNAAVSHLAEIRLSIAEIGKIKNGVRVRRDLPETTDETHLRLTDDEENLLAIGIYNESEKTVQPNLVLV
ncbi:MAG: tRNA pseudouridine(55) synthase TruB [Acidobacteriota bacterium]|nr:tRNA pseudouridine(55) synthase TruB [Acidobacteriota bacterium]